MKRWLRRRLSGFLGGTPGKTFVSAVALVALVGESATTEDAARPARLAEAETAPGPPAPARASLPGVTPEQFGAVGDGVHDDTTAVQRALDVGGTITFTAGKTYRQTNLLFARVAGETIVGSGTVYATNQRVSAFEITADNVTVNGPTFKMGATTKRWQAFEQMKIAVAPVYGTTLRNVHVDGSAAAGIYIGGASHYLVQDVTVTNARADGIHQTAGSHDGIVRRPIVTNVGDDAVAVVSYSAEQPDYNITVESPTINGTPARGISVVGGDNILETNVTVRNTGAACVYIASEPAYRTSSVHGVRVTGAHLADCNTNASVDHGAVLLYNGRPSPHTVDEVTLDGFSISGTRRSASWQVGIVSNGGGTVNRVTFRNFTITGANRALYSQVASYSAINWTVNGVALADHRGL